EQLLRPLQDEVRPVGPHAVVHVRDEQVAPQELPLRHLEALRLALAAELEVGLLVAPLRRRADVAVELKTLQRAADKRPAGRYARRGGEQRGRHDHPELRVCHASRDTPGTRGMQLPNTPGGYLSRGLP